LESNYVLLFIRGFGAADIIKAVKDNFTVKMLDVGWNAIGSFRTKKFADELGQLFTEENLIHIDISHNNINSECCNIIAKQLSNNHSLIGIHADGNYCKIDAKGFLVPTQYPQDRSNLLNNRMQIKIKQKLPNTRSTCWICEGWKEFQFEWDNGMLIT
jgi:hypothetical protein